MKNTSKITLIASTDRPGSQTALISSYLYKNGVEKSYDIDLLDLSKIPLDWLTNSEYSEVGQHEKLSEIQDRFFSKKTTHYIFVVPEYNGSMPGILKLFIDAISVRNYKENFFHKKGCLIGVASGRAGNIRGLDHLSDILNYLGLIIFPEKMPISRIYEWVEKNEIIDPELKKELDRLLDDFRRF
ncbi:MAG: NADPH-dependent oxidoreductase [Saprospirales bacterium]|nr:MAG: NADPH-dependent oxidoreductase [Saprospirales bacterium]